MAKTKDYEDYIDWCYDNGYNPSDYENYDDYIGDVLKNVPPLNFNKWESGSKKSLTSELTEFWNEQNQWISETDEEKKGKIEPIKELKKSRKVKETTFKIEGTLKRSAKRKERTMSKTKQKQMRSIENKTVKGKRLNKTEQNLIKEAKFTRAHEIRVRDKISMSIALKRINKEWKL